MKRDTQNLVAALVMLGCGIATVTRWIFTGDGLSAFAGALMLAAGLVNLWRWLR